MQLIHTMEVNMYIHTIMWYPKRGTEHYYKYVVLMEND